VPVIGEEGKASMPYKGKDAERRKEVEERRGRRDSTYSQAVKSTAREEEKLSRRAKKEGRRTLWKKYTKGSMSTGAGIVHGGGDSLVPNLQRMREQGMSHRR